MHLEAQESMRESAEILTTMANDPTLMAAINTITETCIRALKAGNKLLLMGNGGSAADCQHLAGEMVSRFSYDRPGLPAFALTVDTSVLTAIGNDYGYEKLFARQIEAVAKPGDILFGISTSGRSPNILAGLEVAKRMGVITVAMTGNKKAEILKAADYCIEIPSATTPKIQEGHIVVGHIICGLIEARIFPRSA